MTRNRFSKFAIASIAALAALSATARDLTLEDRVRYQRAIEDVYWRHRLWPAENVTPKPSLAQVMPDAAIRAKVETYLKESAALETFSYRYPERESDYERFLVHRTVFPRDFLADFGFRAIRSAGPVELARLELGGLVPVLEGRRSKVLQALKGTLLPEPVPEPRRP